MVSQDEQIDAPRALAVMLRLDGALCVIVGGGAVALRRARALCEAGAVVRVVAPVMDVGIEKLGCECLRRGYAEGDLDGAALVVAATDEPAVNQRVGEDAAAAGVWVCRADDAAAGRVTFMAAHRDGPVTVAVDSGGASATAAVAIRDELAEGLDRSWAVLLGRAKPWRQHIQQREPDGQKRSAMLRRLTDDAARAALKEGGEEVLEAHLRAVAEGGGA